MKKRTTLGGSFPRVPEIQLLRICLSEMTPNSPSISCHLLHFFFLWWEKVCKTKHWLTKNKKLWVPDDLTEHYSQWFTNINTHIHLNEYWSHQYSFSYFFLLRTYFLLPQSLHYHVFHQKLRSLCCQSPPQQFQLTLDTRFLLENATAATIYMLPSPDLK